MVCASMSFSALASLLIVPLTAQSTTDGTSLHTALMTGYQKHARPGTDYSNPVYVNITFDIGAINAFDEVNSKFVIAGYFVISWVDERLAWNPASYNVLSTTLLPQADVWKPNLILGNPYTKMRYLGLDDFSIRYMYNGQATWNPGDIYSVVCDADVTYYPFDNQTCKLIFSPWCLGLTEVYFQATKSTIGTDMYSSNALWDLTSSQIVVVDLPPLGIQMIELQISVTRRPAFYIVNMILPMSLICIINGFVFILPADSGERVGFSITNLLSIAVFMTILTDTLPEASYPQISILSYLILIQMCMSIVIMLLTIVSLRFYLCADEEDIPKRYEHFVKFMQCKCFKRHSKVSSMNNVLPAGVEVLVDTQNKKDLRQRRGRTSKTPDITAKVVSDNSQIVHDSQIVNDNDETEIVLTWKSVGHAFDRLCLVIILVSSLVIDVGFSFYLLQRYL